MNHSVEETKASEWYKTKVYESKTGKMPLFTINAGTVPLVFLLKNV